ncbi:MAG: hypothetical protein JWO36_3197 [Myxococcales bacterium]|nr:hypothetical protein [Myxococcales bacterium]
MVSFKLLSVIVFGVASAAAAVSNEIWGPRGKARRRLRTGVTAIADRTIVTVSGTVRAPAQPLVAPLSGRPCVLYQSFGRIYDGAGRSRTLRATLERREMISFELEIEGRTVIIDGTTAEIDLRPAPTIPRKLELEVAFVTSAGHSVDYVRGGGFEEITIAPGDKIRVQGMAIVEAELPGERGYRDETMTKVRIVAHDQHPLTIGVAR